ncbi:MAG: SH3 domain-containing protein [Bacteroidales bacterium]|nr:SH3 domain-containing protein [Bacteroidales bacterium]
MKIGGYDFNPRDLTLNLQQNTGRGMPPPIRPRTTSSSSPTYSSPTYYSYSLWERINDGVESIGEWLQDTGAWLIPLIVAGIPAVGGIIWAIVAVISEFAKHGFWNGLVALIVAAFLGTIAYFVLAFAAYIVSKVVYLLGYIFTNAWTLLITLALAGGIWLYAALKNTDHTPKHKYQPRTEQTTPAVTYYRCTANVLNVRAAATTRSQVIGTIQKGEVVGVIGIEGNFAKINWHSQTGYVSRDYIARTGQ